MAFSGMIGAQAMAADAVEGGVGLENVKRRLNLLFPQNYILDIIDTEELYSVTLKIPGL